MSNKSDPIHKNEIPTDYINLCILGCVSVGKSTILNSILCEDISQTKIKRTSMLPTIFIESKNPNTIINYSKYNKEIKEINEELIKMTEEGKTIQIDNYNDKMYYQIQKINLEISKKYNVTLCDMPGLNDAKTKKNYYDYLKKNFEKFNIVLLIIDINSGTNTSDEIDIINFICECISKNNELDKKTKLIVIANKIDDMNWNMNENKLEFGNEEHEEMYNQITKTMNDYTKKYKIKENFEKIIPLCGSNSFLFRMIDKKGKNYELTKSQMIKIGTSEKGQKFKYLSLEEQNKIITNIISDKNFVRDMIKLSGFEELNNTMLKCIENNSCEFVKKNIMYEFKQVGQSNINDFDDTYLKKIIILSKLIKFDYDEFENQFNKIFKELTKEFIKKLSDENFDDFMLFYNYYELEYISNVKKIIELKNNCENYKLFDLVISKNILTHGDTIINLDLKELFHNYIELELSIYNNIKWSGRGLDKIWTGCGFDRSIKKINEIICILKQNQISNDIVNKFIKTVTSKICVCENFRKTFFHFETYSVIKKEFFSLFADIIDKNLQYKFVKSYIINLIQNILSTEELVEKYIYYKIKKEIILVEIIKIRIIKSKIIDDEKLTNIYCSLNEPNIIINKIEKNQDPIEKYYFANYI